MTEREEFELVAKAAGYEYKWINDPPWGVGHRICIKDFWYDWNPKTVDGDSRRLQVDLGIDVSTGDTFVLAGTEIHMPKLKAFKNYHDKYTAVRAAVWEVAVEVAKRRMEK